VSFSQGSRRSALRHLRPSPSFARAARRPPMHLGLDLHHHFGSPQIRKMYR
jgi:hypothetical protein